MTKTEWLDLAIQAIRRGSTEKAITYINEVKELIKLEDSDEHERRN